MQQTAVVPDVTYYNAAIRAREKRQQWKQALSVLAEMQLTAVLTLSFPIVPPQRLREGPQWKQSLRVLAVMQQVVVLPNYSPALPPSGL